MQPLRTLVKKNLQNSWGLRNLKSTNECQEYTRREHRRTSSAQTATKKDKREQDLKLRVVNGAPASSAAGWAVISPAACPFAANNATMLDTFVANASIKSGSLAFDRLKRIIVKERDSWYQPTSSSLKGLESHLILFVRLFLSLFSLRIIVT